MSRETPVHPDAYYNEPLKPGDTARVGRVFGTAGLALLSWGHLYPRLMTYLAETFPQLSAKQLPIAAALALIFGCYLSLWVLGKLGLDKAIPGSTIRQAAGTPQERIGEASRMFAFGLILFFLGGLSKLFAAISNFIVPMVVMFLLFLLVASKAPKKS